MRTRKRGAFCIFLFGLMLWTAAYQPNNVQAEEAASQSTVKTSKVELESVIKTVEASDQEASETTEESVEKVRVGYYYCALFQEGMDDETVKSGYSYDYLQKVADYTGWDYTYVYGDWTTLLQDLEDGEIDVLAGVSITDERKNYISYPDNMMGQDYYYLYKHSTDETISVEDLQTINDKKIGAIKDNLMTTYLLSWLDEKGLTPEVVYYESFTDRDADFEAGNLDMVVTTDNNVLNSSGYEPLAKVGEEPYYLAVCKNRQDLLAELNTGLAKLHDLEPYYLENLQYASYGNTTTNTRLSEDEDEWVNEHGVIKVGYLADYLPYCTEEDGKAKGLLVDSFDEILKQLDLKDRLKVEYTVYNTYDELLEAVHSGDVDAIFPVGGDSWYQEQDGIDSVSPLVTAGMDVVYKGDYSDDVFEILAINENNKLTYYYALSNYIDSKFVFCSSVEECFEAVESGKATGAFINGLRIDAVVKNSKYSNLSTAQLEKTVIRTIGVEDGNTTLLILLNRGIKAIGSEYGINASYNYVDELYSTSFEDIIKQNFKKVFAVIFFTAAILIIIAVATIRKLHKEAVVRERYLKELESARRDTQTAREESNTDGLTGFGNRRAFENALCQLEEEGTGQEFAIVSMDVNGLKVVNDNQGHSAGDELICGAACCMQQVFEKYGNLYRTGGDEFVALIHIKKEELKEAVDNLECVTRAWSGDSVKTLSISIGCVSKEECREMSVRELEILADKRMYENKSLYYSMLGQDRRGAERGAYTKLFRTYEKVLKVDLDSDTYQVIKLNRSEQNDDAGFEPKYSDWTLEFANSGNVKEEDRSKYLAKMNINYIRGQFDAGAECIKFFYDRKIQGQFRRVMTEIVPADDYCETNPQAYLYVKNISE